MNAVVKRPEVPCESQAPLLTLPARPLHTGTGGKRKWARRFPGSSPRAGGAGSRARGPGRPLNPLCRAAAPMAALLSSAHTGLPPLAQTLGPAPAPPAAHLRLGRAGPPQPLAASAPPCSGWRSITQLVCPRPRTYTRTPLLCTATPAPLVPSPSARCRLE